MTREECIQLNLVDISSDGVIGILLNKFKAANLTVCPECRMDDFSHIETCSIWQELEGE